jgi:hypothetical protein
MTTATATVSRQKVTAILRKAGYPISVEVRNGIIGYAARTGGWSVIDNGTTEYICKSCRTRDSHRPGCSTRSGAAKYWRQEKVKDGTVTVEMQHGSGLHGFDLDAALKQVAGMAAFLTDAGLKVTQDGDSAFRLQVSA